MAAQSGPSSSNPGVDSILYDDRSSEVIGASVVLIVLPSLAVFLRLLSRWMSHAGFWWDDAVATLAMIIACGPNIIILVALYYGFGKHIAVQPPQTIFTELKILYGFEFLYICAICSIKYSIILFQYRIFPIALFRRILRYATAYTVAFTGAGILIPIFQCIPIHTFWDTFAGKLDPQVKVRCINLELYFLIYGGINTVTDFILLALPIPILWRLKTGRPQKILLTGIFAMGLM